MKKEDILESVYLAINEINDQLPKNRQIEKKLDAPIFGKEGVLDSLALVNFIVGVESEIEDRFDVTITLADEKAMSQVNSPFNTVATLVDYIASITE